MDPRDDDLARRIRLGEDSELELKRVLFSGDRITGPRRDDMADELAAFANGNGGTIVLGVDDATRDIVGLPLTRLDLVETWVREICNDAIQPPLYAVIRRMELLDATGASRPLVRVDVDRSLFVHRSPGGYYRRIGSSKREMPPDVLARLFQERSQSRVIRFDESPVPATTPEDIDWALAARFLPTGTASELQWLRKLRLVADDERGDPRLTVAGVLLATRQPQRWLGFAEIQAVGYAGDRRDVNYQTDARDIGGPLDEQVSEALHFVQRNARVLATKRTSRTESPQFSDRVIFEAIVNAVAHRDYAMSGARIRLHLFRDRLELYVPGSLPNTLTPDSMALRQYSRNELIVSLLARTPVEGDRGVSRRFLMDRRGEGVPIILAEALRLSGRAPQYTVLDESELQLIVWAAPDPTDATVHRTDLGQE